MTNPMPAGAPEATERLEVPTPDGRVLEVVLGGDPGGRPLVVHHGTPQGAVPWPYLDRPAAERGLRTVAYSRPGYGGSTRRGDDAYTVADDARDTAIVLDHLGHETFLTLGWSGGGPRALACAAVLPGRCLGAVCGVGLAPPAEFDGDIREGMGQENVEEFTAAMTGRTELAAFLQPYSAELATATPEDIVAAFGDLVPEVDRRALVGEVAETVAASMRAGARQGIDGWLDDDLAMLAPWGFDLASITVPVSIWQGSEDRMVPLRHAEWLAAHVPGSRAHLVLGEGHFSLYGAMAEILDDLLAHALERPAAG